MKLGKDKNFQNWHFNLLIYRYMLSFLYGLNIIFNIATDMNVSLYESTWFKIISQSFFTVDIVIKVVIVIRL